MGRANQTNKNANRQVSKLKGRRNMRFREIDVAPAADAAESSIDTVPPLPVRNRKQVRRSESLGRVTHRRPPTPVVATKISNGATENAMCFHVFLISDGTVFGSSRRTEMYCAMSSNPAKK